jgi:hypothetical protein
MRLLSTDGDVAEVFDRVEGGALFARVAGSACRCAGLP